MNTPSKIMFQYEYPKADNTVDNVVFGLDPTDKDLKILLIQRKDDPFMGMWALPGGFVDVFKDPTLKDSALRELLEETGIGPQYTEQLATYGDMGRDPRGRVISTAFLSLVRPQDVHVKAGDDAKEAKWIRVRDLDLNPDFKGVRTLQMRYKLAFDHHKVVKTALDRIRSKVRWQPIGIELLPEEFTLGDLQRVYEAILSQKLDKRNFRKKVNKLNVLKATTRSTREQRQGPAAKLYKFDRRRYEKLRDSGVDFEV